MFLMSPCQERLVVVVVQEEEEEEELEEEKMPPLFLPSITTSLSQSGTLSSHLLPGKFKATVY